MGNMPLEPRIKYQEELDLGFGRSVVAHPGAEDLYRCIQCGTCSSTCPLVTYMEHTPRRIIAMTRAGLKNDVLKSNTIWLCSSCYSCTVACPKQIKITDVMYTLKREAIRSGVHADMPIPVLAGEFIKSVARTGRSNEMRIITATWLKTKPFELFKQAWMGLRLWLKGRLSFGLHRMSGDRRQIRKLLVAAGEQNLGPRGG